MPLAITIAGTTVRQDPEGRYCLNDLHKAAGGAPKHTPGRFTLTEAYTGLRDSLSRKQDNAPTISKPGQGTYVAKVIVYAYAAWISPDFHLHVLEVFDQYATKGIAMRPEVATEAVESPESFLARAVLVAQETLTKVQQELAPEPVAA